MLIHKSQIWLLLFWTIIMSYYYYFSETEGMGHESWWMRQNQGVNAEVRAINLHSGQFLLYLRRAQSSIPEGVKHVGGERLRCEWIAWETCPAWIIFGIQPVLLSAPVNVKRSQHLRSIRSLLHFLDTYCVPWALLGLKSQGHIWCSIFGKDSQLDTSKQMCVSKFPGQKAWRVARCVCVCGGLKVSGDWWYLSDRQAG